MTGELEAPEPLPLVPGTVTASIRLTADLIRLDRRGRCFVCRRRRVLYRIRVWTGIDHAETEARCAVCWNVREGNY